MIKKEELLYFQKQLYLPLSTIEKDYVLSLLIWGISQNQILKSSWIFKGGTCLKKCFFGNYRFSEDLDYTLTNDASISSNFIETRLSEVFSLIYERFGLKIYHENLSIQPFPDKKGLFIQIKIPFQGPLLSSGSLPKIKLDLSQEELLVDTPIHMPLHHPYSDKNDVATSVLCYSIYEIFAEKLRAFVQRTRPRDLYDIVYLHTLFQKNHLNIENLKTIAHKKFKHHHLIFPDSLNTLNPQAIENAKSDWTIMLAHQISELEPFETFIEKANILVGSLK